MTTIDSYLFLALGTIMQAVPALAPQYFPPTGIVGSNGSELWLEFMGWVNYLVAAAGIAHLQLLPGWRQFAQWAEASWTEIGSLEQVLSSLDLLAQLDGEPGRGASLSRVPLSGSLNEDRQSQYPNPECL